METTRNIALVVPGEGAVVIPFPDIQEQVREILKQFYTENVAEQYASMVQHFFEENASFPTNGIYMLVDGSLCCINIQTKSWEKAGSAASYVISKGSEKFWKAFEEQIPYLKSYKESIQDLIQSVTSGMFSQKMEDSSFVCRDKEGKITIGIADRNAILLAISDYVNPLNIGEYIVKILKEVFQSEEMPIFVIDNGITVAAITRDSILTDFDENRLKNMLTTSFSSNDVEHLQKRIMNAIKYSVITEEHVFVNEKGEFIIQIDGLHVIPSKDLSKGIMACNSHNRKILAQKLNGKVRKIWQHGGGYEIRYYPQDNVGIAAYEEEICFVDKSNVAKASISFDRNKIFIGGVAVAMLNGNDEIEFFDDIDGCMITILSKSDDNE